jgi:hypothetical protein
LFPRKDVYRKKNGKEKDGLKQIGRKSLAEKEALKQIARNRFVEKDL